MASNQVELVVTVEVDKANQSIKSVNTNLGGIEQTAVRVTRVASHGMDAMTASMVKGATAGNLLADAIKEALRWVKEFTIDALKDAAHVERMQIATFALAKAHGIAAAQVKKTTDALIDLNFEDEEALRTINRLIVADLGLQKAEGLAKLAKDAAILDENLTAPEALEGILRAIEFGQERALKQLGIRVKFDKEIELAELKLGRTLSENEKIQFRYNAVMKAGAEIQGAAAAASGNAESMLKKLKQEFGDLREEIGQQFQDEFKAFIQALRDLVKWLRENVDLLKKFAEALVLIGGAFATYKVAATIIGITEAVKDLTAAMVAGRLATLGNPMALMITGGVLAGGAIYKSYFDMRQYQENLWKEQETKMLREDLLSGKLKPEDLKRDRGMTDDQIRELVFGRRLLPGAEKEWPKLDLGGWGKVTIVGQEGKKEDLDAEIARLKRAKEIGEFQRKAEQDAIQSATQTGAKALPGFAGDVAELNEKIRKWTTMDDGTRIKLTAKAWIAVIDELSVKWEAFKAKFQKDNREAIADYVKAEEEARQQRMDREAELYQARLRYNEDVARQNLEHVKQLMQIEQDRAGVERDARIRTLEGYDSRTIEQKVRVEQQKAQIEINYIEEVDAIKQRLFDLETSQRVLDYELEMKRLGYRADEIQARIAEYTQQRDQIRQAGQEATDASVDAARRNAANRTADLIRDHNQKIFDSLKRQAEGVFDALVSKSQSVWSAIGNSFKTAMLTAIKEVVTSQVARMLMGLFGGARGGGGYAPAGAGGGGGLGALLGGIGIFSGGGGGPVPGGSAGGWGTPPFVPSGGGGGGGGGTWSWATMGAGYKNWLTNLGNIGFRPERWRMDEAGNMTKLSGARGVGGWQGGAMLLGGSILAMEGLRRGGWSGVGMTTAGGALIGAKFGGPLGAAIGAIAGFAAGMIRKFWIKTGAEKVREKIKTVYGVDIHDQALLKQIADMAKSAYGGNLDMVVQSQAVRELVELYAMTTGQTYKGASSQVQSVSISQSGGSLFQTTGYSNGTPLASLSGLPSLDTIGRGAPSGGGLVVNITVPGAKEFFEKETVRVVVDNPRAVQSATMTATKQNAGRREMASLQMGVGLLTT